MTIGEARRAYSAQLKSYNIQKCSLGRQKAALDEKIKRTENGAAVYADEAATLELTYSAVAEKQDEYQRYMDNLMEQWNVKCDEVAVKNNAEAEKKGFEELRKVLEVVRRMTRGDTVPAYDEKKVMEYDRDMYQLAKSAQMVAQMRKKDREKHDSLWDEEKKENREDPMEAADGQEAFADGPEIISVEDTMAATMDSDSEA